jgi:hypothetical protein
VGDDHCANEDFIALGQIQEGHSEFGKGVFILRLEDSLIVAADDGRKDGGKALFCEEKLFWTQDPSSPSPKNRKGWPEEQP